MHTTKIELNEFPAETLSALTYPSDRQFIVTHHENILSNCGMTMPVCSHEEADTRLLHHVKHALSENMTFVQILSNDTDVVILALGVYHTLCSNHIFDDLVIEFGMGKNYRKISIKSLADSLGQLRSQALVFFHAFSGCDTTSAFKSIGKKKSYEALKAYPEIETIFADFHVHPFPQLNENDSRFQKIERFVILMYSRTSISTSVNEVRMNMYFSRTQNIENIPPTRNALFFHTKRALYQSGVWSRCLDAQQNLPSPKGFGWKENDDAVVKWIPYWMSQSEASKECREFIKCSCKAACIPSRCTCKGADFKCTLLCKCNCSDKVTYE